MIVNGKDLPDSLADLVVSRVKEQARLARGRITLGETADWLMRHEEGRRFLLGQETCSRLVDRVIRREKRAGNLVVGPRDGRTSLWHWQGEV